MHFLKVTAFVFLVTTILPNNNRIEINAEGLNQTKHSDRIVVSRAEFKPQETHKYASPAYNKAYARETMGREYNWGSKQFNCLVSLWNKESMWRVDADNPHSSAYGIPQALPGSKMGEGWQTDPHVQINWGLEYISNRYDTPCGAWSAFNKKGWY